MRHVRRILVIAATGTALAALSAVPASASGLADVDGLGGEPCVTVLENYEQNGLQITFDRAVAVYSVNQCLG